MSKKGLVANEKGEKLLDLGYVAQYAKFYKLAMTQFVDLVENPDIMDNITLPDFREEAIRV